MKEKPADGCVNHYCEEEARNEKPQESAQGKQKKGRKGNGKEQAAAWIRKLMPALETITIDEIPKFFRITGQKSRVQVTMHEESKTVICQIQEAHRPLFRTESQLHTIAHYIGMRILQQKFLAEKGGDLGRFLDRIFILERSHTRLFRIELVLNKSSDLINFYVKNYLTWEELLEKLSELVDCFEDERDKKQVENAIDKLLDGSEIEKAKRRIYMKDYRKGRKENEESNVLTFKGKE